MRSSVRQATALLRHARAASRRQIPASLAPALQARHHTTSSPAGTSSSSSSPSVNASEISHFNALAATWWDPHGSSRALHLMNPHRHDFIRACRSSSPQSVPLPTDPDQQLWYLDIGCGGGIFAESAARLPSTHSVTAIDPSPGVLAVARQHAARDPALMGGKLQYLSSTVEMLGEHLSSPFSTRTDNAGGLFDVVTCFEVVEHVDHPAAFLDRCGAFVKPGGWLVLSTIARTWTSWFTTNLVAEDILGIVPKGTHDWNKYINEDELRAHFAARPGWGSPRVMGVVFVPGMGWKEVPGSEKLGNYFLGVQRTP